MESLFTDCGAVVIGSPSNLFYFSGYRNDDARILLTPGKKYYLTDSRTAEEAKELLCDFTLVDVARGEYTESTLNLLKELGVTSAGYEDETVTHAEYLKLESAGLTLSPSQERINRIRAVKNEKEIALIQKAQAITEMVFDDMLGYLKPGMTEKEAEAKLNSLIYGYGGTLAFDSIVAFGKNTSKPHAHPSENKLQKDDVITLDFGAKYGGYCSDMTRSFAIGKVDNEYKRIYHDVLNAQEEALCKLKSGVIGKEGDAYARAYLEGKGLAAYFTHSLGHSLGIDIHEPPNLSPRCLAAIPEGAVLSVEPGVYFEGRFGIRIEDIVVFKNNGVDNLTKSPKQLIIL